MISADWQAPGAEPVQRTLQNRAQPYLGLVPRTARAASRLAEECRTSPGRGSTRSAIAAAMNRGITAP
jgi:hypothetical protein